jgi:hypothetical protein
MLGFRFVGLTVAFFLGCALPVRASSVTRVSIRYCVRKLYSQYQDFRLSQKMFHFSEQARVAFEQHGDGDRADLLFTKAFQTVRDRHRLMTYFKISHPEMALTESALAAWYEPDRTIRPTFVGLLLSYVSRSEYTEKISFALEGWDEVLVLAQLESEDVVLEKKQTIERRTPALLSRLLFSLHRDLTYSNVNTDEKLLWCRDRSLLQGIRDAKAALPPEDEDLRIALQIQGLCKEIALFDNLQKRSKKDR